jgi:hypothetical protein
MVGPPHHKVEMWFYHHFATAAAPERWIARVRAGAAAGV